MRRSCCHPGGMRSLQPARYPVSAALAELMDRKARAVLDRPVEVTEEQAFAWAVAVEVNALMSGLTEAVASLEAEVYMLRAELQLPLETLMDPAIGAEPWDLSVNADDRR